MADRMFGCLDCHITIPLRHSYILQLQTQNIYGHAVFSCRFVFWQILDTIVQSQKHVSIHSETIASQKKQKKNSQHPLWVIGLEVLYTCSSEGGRLAGKHFP